MIKYQTTLSIGQEDKDKETKLVEKGYTKISIYRSGIEYLLKIIKES